jgi:hypothetical protein
VDLPRGVLDGEIEELLRAGTSYLSREPALLAEVPTLAERIEWLPTVARTLPWRLGLWRGPEGNRLLVVAAAGGGRFLRRLPDLPPRAFSLGEKLLWVGLRDGVVGVGELREHVEAVFAQVPAARRETVAAAPSIAIGARWPGEGGQFRGRLERAEGDTWSLTYALLGAGAGPTRLALPRELLEREGIVVTVRRELSPTGDGGSGEWSISGITTMMRAMSEDLRGWSAR